MSADNKPQAKEKKKYTLVLTGWQLVGYSGMLVGLMVWLFALGVLVGRGDINYWLHKLGLSMPDLVRNLGLVGEAPEQPVGPETPKIDHPAPAVPGKPVVEAPPAAPAPAAPATPVAAEPKAPAAKAAKKEAGKANAPRPEAIPGVASHLPFQNSQDRLPGKPKSWSRTAGSGSSDPATGGKKPATQTSYQLRIGETYPTAHQAQKVAEELKKKGLKVTVQPQKKGDRTVYVLKSDRLTSKQEAEKLAQRLKENKYQGQIETHRP